MPPDDRTPVEPTAETSDERPARGSGSSQKEGANKLLDGASSLDATKAAFTPGNISDQNAAQRLSLFYELPLRFGEKTRLDALLQLIVDRIVEVIPRAQRGAVLVKDRSGKLALKAHLPAGQPSVSLTLAQRAMDQHCAFIWPPISASTEGTPPSIALYRIQSAMYAPLLWGGESFGALCVDNESGAVFSAEDLQLLQAVAHHAAMAVANLELHQDRREQMQVLNNILKLVSPQLGDRLKQRTPVRLGGEFRDVTILIADIRGFTNLSATMTPYEVTQMLEDYFGSLVPIVFKHKRLSDKFVGDAILAVFGSPDPDEHQHLHAVAAALEMQSAMKQVNVKRGAGNSRTGELGIGLHCGEVVHGFIGTSDRMEYTVIGDTVNQASRYCDGAAGGEVLISSDLYQWIWNSIKTEQTTISTKHEGDLT